MDRTDLFPFRRTDSTRPPKVYADLFADGNPVCTDAVGGTLVWLVGTHRQVKEALINDAMSSDPRASAFPPVFPRRESGDIPTSPRHRALSAMDGHEHATHRRRVAREFSRAAVEAATPRLQALAAELFADADETIDDFAVSVVSPYVHDALAAFFVDGDPVMVSILNEYRWSQQSPAALAFSSRDFRAGLTGLIRARQASDRNDLVSRVSRRYAGGDPENVAAELVEIIGSIIVAGTTTTISAICIGTKLLADNSSAIPRDGSPEGGAWLRAVNEILRFSSIADLVTARTARATLDIDGITIPRGSGVVALTGAANHDPSVFVEPAMFDPDRTDLDQHLAFGHGIHRCLGRHLAVAIIGNFLVHCFSRDASVIRYEYSPDTSEYFNPFPLPKMTVQLRSRAQTPSA